MAAISGSNPMMVITAWEAVIMVKLGLVLVLLGCAAGISAASWHQGSALPPFLVLSLGMFAASITPAWRGLILSPRLVLSVAAAMHAIALLGVPLFEDDFFRYLWDGYRTATSGTPYGPPPEAFFTDPNVPKIMRRVLDGVGYPETPTIYGPVLQAVFWLSHLAAPGQERVLRALLCAANLALIALLLRKVSPAQAALYAWSPLAFKEIALSGHPDGLLALLLLIGIGLGARRGVLLLGAMLGLAAGVKLSALAAWPALLRLAHFQAAGASPTKSGAGFVDETLGPNLRMAMLGAGAALAALTLAYLPFLRSSGTVRSDLAGLAAFAARWEFNAGPYALVNALIGPFAAKLLLGALAATAILAVHLRAKPAQGLYPFHLVFGCVLVISPVVNPWYLLWALPFACGSRQIWPWAASLALLLSYCSGQQLPGSGLALFAVHPVAQTLEWAAILAAAAWDLRNARLRNAL